MRSGATRIPLILAGVSAAVAYLIIGRSSPLDLLHLVHSAHHDRDAQTASAVPALPAIPAVPAIPSIPAVGNLLADASLPKPASRALEDFDMVELDGEVATTISIGDVPSVAVTDTPDRADAVSTQVHHGKLIVTGSGGALRITLPHLRKLQVNRAGGITLTGLCDPLAITINGVASLRATGEIDTLDLVLNGASKLDLAKLEAKNVSIRMNGVSDAEVFATETLTVELHGPGHVRYRGEPHVTSSVAWPGSVTPISRAS